MYEVSAKIEHGSRGNRGGEGKTVEVVLILS